MVANSPHKQIIGRAVMQWMRYRLSHKMPGLTMPDIDELLKGTEMIETDLERIRANLIAEGVFLVRQEDRRELVTLLARLLTKRFGQLAEDINTRLECATTEQLEIWVERILDAQTLGQVFGEH